MTFEPPERLLIAMPTWIGDAVMATPALRMLREALPETTIGGLFKPGPEALFDGLGVFDRVHLRRSTGVLGPKMTGFRLRPERYDSALLLSNAFSTALITRVAGIDRRVGYRRDARGPLISDGITPPKRADGSWAPVPAVEYYWTLANHFVRGAEPNRPDDAWMTLAVTDRDREECAAALGAEWAAEPYAVLVPGGSKDEKRWPAERFGALAAWLHQEHGLRVLVSGGPSERDVCDAVVSAAGLDGSACRSLVGLGLTLRGLKPVLGSAALLVTNDTGPRHVAVALATPVVTLFGPTDHRWTTVPTRPGAPEVMVLADPTIGESELANDDPDRHRIDRIEVERVIEACGRALNAPQPRVNDR
ncbi:MAG: glycosyltransferase family 9 protein [Planctomycetota bacterium]